MVNDGVALSMTVDDLGHVHVITGGNGTGLDYATDASGTWRSVHIAGPHALMPSVALSRGKVYVAFARKDSPGERGKGIRIVSNATGSWQFTTITRDDASFPSLRMSNDRFHIAYRDALGVRYVSDSTGTVVNSRVWSRGNAIDSTLDHSPVSLALDGRGRPRIAFERQEPSGAADGIAYARRVDGAWVLRRVTSGKDPLDRIVVDQRGRARIGYGHIVTPGDVRFRIATFEGGHRTIRQLPGKGFGSFTLDGHGRIELLRTDEDAGRVTWMASRSDGWRIRSWSDPHPDRPAVRAFDGTSWVVYDTHHDSHDVKTILRMRE